MGCPASSATVLLLLLGPGDTISDRGTDAPSLQFYTSQTDSITLDASRASTASVKETLLRVLLPLSQKATLDAYTWRAALLHRYRTITFEALASRADFNGDVHVLGFGLQGLHTSRQRRRAVSAMPVITTSSNALKNPHALRASDLSLWVSWIDHREQTISISWLYGLQIDNRFGDYLPYPTAGATWEPRPGTLLQLAYPDARWHQYIAPQFSLDLRLSPDGGRWHVHNKNMERQSDFSWEKWRASLALNWSHPSGLIIEISAGMLVQQTMQIPLENGSVLATDLEDARFTALSAGWRWR